MSKFAVIETGGKQYLVSEGQKLKIEKIKTPKGDIIKFDKVLLIGDKSKLDLGKPYVSQFVEAKILKEDRAKKVIVLKYKSKKRYRIKRGHRQPYTEIQITKIGAVAEKSTISKPKTTAKSDVKKTTKPKTAK
jgi:large subunit ribosomal protein L21